MRAACRACNQRRGMNPAQPSRFNGGGRFAKRTCRRIPTHFSVPKFRFGDFVTADFFADAEGRSAEAAARRDAIRDAWEAEGAPLLSVGSTGQPVEHPS